MPADATQRVRVEGSAPVRRPAPQSARRSESAAPAAPSRKRRRSRRRNVTVIALSAIAAVVLIAVIASCFIMFSSPEDDGLILNNVIVAGVNLGGKTPEEAKALLQKSVGNAYSTTDMVVEVHDTKVVLSPKDTGAKLDIDAVVEKAYSYGRTGSRAERQKAKQQSLTSSHVISLIPYLNLDTDYIHSAVDSLGNKYSSTLSQPQYRVEGQRPDLNTDPGAINTDTVYQKLFITVGTPEYSLHTGNLYDQILAAYNTYLFEVVGEISVRAPEKLDLDAVYAELSVAPVDATLDEFTYEVTPEKYGYGFRLEEIRTLLENAQYGQTLEVPLRFLAPDLTADELTDGLFETILSSHKAPLPVEKEILINLKLACRAINGTRNGLILKAGEIFSFNEIIGLPAEIDGYKLASVYVGNTVKEIVGGGISQVASTLYYCALMADLEIVERTGHFYATNFIETGLDADVLYGERDLVFKNTTGRPIRIEADVTDDGYLEIRFWGTENPDYSVEILYETVDTYLPETLINTMIPDNPDGYLNGDILVQPIVGYDVSTYKIYRYADDTIEPVKVLIAETHYEKLDKVVIEIDPTFPPLPVDPSTPTEAPSAPAEDPVI